MYSTVEFTAREILSSVNSNRVLSHKLLFMMRYIVIFVIAAIVGPVFSSEGSNDLTDNSIIGEDVDNLGSLLSSDYNAVYMGPLDNGLQEVAESASPLVYSPEDIVENVSSWDGSRDRCVQGGKFSRRESGACQTDENPRGFRPQHPREGVTFAPQYLQDAIITTPHNIECSYFGKRTLYMTCGGPEAFMKLDSIFDSVFVLNCIRGKHTSDLPVI